MDGSRDNEGTMTRNEVSTQIRGRLSTEVYEVCRIVHRTLRG